MLKVAFIHFFLSLLPLIQLLLQRGLRARLVWLSDDFSSTICFEELFDSRPVLGQRTRHIIYVKVPLLSQISVQTVLSRHRNPALFRRSRLSEAFLFYASQELLS